MSRRKTQEEVVSEFKEIWGERFNYEKVTYVNTNVKVTIVCKDHGDFLLMPYQHKAGAGCYKCGRESTGAKNKIKVAQTQDDYIAACVAKHGNRYDYSKTVYRHSNSRVIIGCRKHGDFTTKAASHKYGSGCTKCVMEERSKSYSMSPETWASRVNEKHGDRFKYLTEFTGLDYSITIKCSIHGVFDQIASHHLAGHGCPKCGWENSGKLREKSNSDYLAECKEVHGELYDYTKTFYTGISELVTITCSKHGDFVQRANVHSAGSGCPKCRRRISKPASAWLSSVGAPLIECYLPDIRRYADGYDPETRTAFLFHGDYWHGNPKVHNADEMNPTTKLTFGEMYKQTLLVEQQYKDAGYNIVVMWEYDWKKSNR